MQSQREQPTQDEPPTVGPEPSRTGKRAERAWIWGILGYSVLRFVVAWGSFGPHGVNPWIFGLIDIGTAWPYARSTASMVRAGWRSDWTRFALWSVVAIVTFFAPYAYIWLAGDEVPTSLRLGLALVVTTLFVGAGAGIARKIVKGGADAVV